jgi:hypothetical protein
MRADQNYGRILYILYGIDRQRHITGLLLFREWRRALASPFYMYWHVLARALITMPGGPGNVPLPQQYGAHIYIYIYVYNMTIILLMDENTVLARARVPPYRCGKGTRAPRYRIMRANKGTHGHVCVENVEGRGHQRARRGWLGPWIWHFHRPSSVNSQKTLSIFAFRNEQCS